ncbi:MAG: SpoIIE family protein phosphatase [Planctomycetota bacterium]
MEPQDDPQPTLAFNARATKPAQTRPVRQASHYLALREASGLERLVALTDRPLSIGRDPQADLCLAGAGVSRRHCELRLVDGGARIRDLGSTNGTHVDDQLLVGEGSLPVGSSLRVGEHFLRHRLLTDEEVGELVERAAELERARAYVEAQLPAPLDEGPIRTDWCFVPSSGLGGDALGYSPLGDGRLAFYLLDVCGHGVDSAMHAASALHVLRDRRLLGVDPARPAVVLDRVNSTFPMEAHRDLFFTLWYGVIDVERGQLCYASAGHSDAVLIDTACSVRERFESGGPPIGVVPGVEYVERCVRISTGERVCVFSDGAHEWVDLEGRSRSRADFEGLLCEALRGGSSARRLYEVTRTLVGKGALDDDFSLLTVRLEQA